MPKRSKRYTESKALIDSKKIYTPDEAVELVKKTATTKFESSVEVHVRLGIDVKQSDQQIRATITFPHSTGKTKKIAAFVPEAKQKEAKEAGADMVGAEDLIDEIAKTNKVDFDIAVATPDMMPKLAKIAKVLGPKGIMPNPKTDTVGPNVKKLVEDLKKGKVAYKNDAQGIVHQAIGKTSLNASALLENFQSLIESLRKHKPSSAKGLYFKSVTLSSTMGPGIKVDVSGI